MLVFEDVFHIENIYIMFVSWFGTAILYIEVRGSTMIHIH